MSKCDSLLLSLVTPCHCESLDQKVYEFNKRLFDKFRDVEKAKMSMISKFTQNERLRKYLYNDAIRISRDGVSVLAANLKRMLKGNNKMANKPLDRQTQTFRNNKLNSAQLASDITNAILSVLNM
jgi:hypothetical protein